MKKAGVLAVLFVFTGGAYAGTVMEQLKAAGGAADKVIAVPAAPTPAKAAKQAAKPAKQMTTMSVDMRIRGYSGGYQYDIEERSAGIDMNVRKNSSSDFSFSGNVDGRYVSGRVTKHAGDAYSLSASGINLDMRKSGARHEISGFVDEKEGSRHMDVDLREDYPGRLTVWEHGVSLDISKFGSDYDARGDIDTSRFGKKALAMVAVCVTLVDSQKQAKDRDD